MPNIYQNTKGINSEIKLGFTAQIIEGNGKFWKSTPSNTQKGVKSKFH